jgi:hypothetical protein
MATAIFSLRNINSGEEEEHFEYFHYQFIIHQICVWSYSNALGSSRRCYRMSAPADQRPRLSLALLEPTLEVTVADGFSLKTSHLVWQASTSLQPNWNANWLFGSSYIPHPTTTSESHRTKLQDLDQRSRCI